MRTQHEKAKLEACIQRFRKLIEDVYSTESLLDTLDDILFNYAMYTLQDKDLGANRKKRGRRSACIKIIKGFV
jgi:hypothetical protein